VVLAAVRIFMLLFCVVTRLANRPGLSGTLSELNPLSRVPEFGKKATGLFTANSVWSKELPVNFLTW
jgi:hypothetical protein